MEAAWVLIEQPSTFFADKHMSDTNICLSYILLSAQDECMSVSCKFVP